MAHDVFVSYSSKDKTIADTLVATLEKNNIRCWYAPRDIKPSDDWAQAITNAIENSKLFLIIFSGNANQSQRVLDEVNFSISEEIPILPFRIENIDPVGAMKLHLSSRHWLDAYDPSWEAHIKRLVSNVSTILETTIEEEEIQLPEKVENVKQRQKKKRLGRILPSFAAVLILGTASWFGFRYLFPPNLEKENAETQVSTSQVKPSPTTEITQITEPEEQEEIDAIEVDDAEMVYVPEGEFLMGSEDGGGDEAPEHTVYVDAFWIYKHEVTNEQYRSCIEAGECEGNLENYPENNYPAVYIYWHEADAYCEWAGGRLPTEAEWEKAARGEDGRTYPWGEEQLNCNLANFKDCGGLPEPVGSYPAGASPYGALDMVGNAREWVADWYDADYYSVSPGSNPVGPADGDHHILRGCTFAWSLRDASVSDRVKYNPNSTNTFVGFRCIIEAKTEETETTPESKPSWVTDFAEPILAEINDITPYFEDNFTTKSSAWNSFDNWKITIEDGEMLVRDANVVWNQLITFHDYLLEVDLRIIAPGNHGISISNGSAVYYQFYLDESNNLRAGLGDSISFNNDQIYKRYPLTENIFHLRLIVKGARIAFYVNQEPLLFLENEDFRLYQGDSEKLVALFSNANDTPSDPDPIGAAFSNFKVWNLTHIEVP